MRVRLLFSVAIICILFLSKGVEAGDLIDIEPRVALFNASLDGYFYPGKVLEKQLTVKNVGSGEVNISHFSATITRDKLLANGLMIRIEEAVNGRTLLFEGKMSDLESEVRVSSSPIKAGDQRVFFITVFMPLEMGNEYQGLTLEVNLTVGATGEIIAEIAPASAEEEIAKETPVPPAAPVPLQPTAAPTEISPTPISGPPAAEIPPAEQLGPGAPPPGFPGSPPEGTTPSENLYMGKNLLLSGGIVFALEPTGGRKPVECNHDSNGTVYAELLEFSGTQVLINFSGWQANVTCRVSGLAPNTNYTIEDKDYTSGTTSAYSYQTDIWGNLIFTIKLSDHRVMVSTTPLSIAAGIAATAAFGTAIAAVGAMAVTRAGSAVITTSIARFDFLQWVFKNVFKIKEVAVEIAKEGAIHEEPLELPSLSFESIIKLSKREEAYIGYVIVALFAASAIEAWVKQHFELKIVVIGAVLAITGYLAHEFMHKFMALRYRTRMEFKSTLLAGIITFISAAIGAPVAPVALGELHDEPLNKQQRMLVSISGPMANIAFAAIFIAFSLAFVSWRPYLEAGITLNIAMAVASILPVGFLEGKRVWQYSKALCIFLLFITLAMQLSASLMMEESHTSVEGHAPAESHAPAEDLASSEVQAPVEGHTPAEVHAPVDSHASKS